MSVNAIAFNLCRSKHNVFPATEKSRIVLLGISCGLGSGSIGDGEVQGLMTTAAAVAMTTASASRTYSKWTRSSLRINRSALQESPSNCKSRDWNLCMNRLQRSNGRILQLVKLVLVYIGHHINVNWPGVRLAKPWGQRKRTELCWQHIKSRFFVTGCDIAFGIPKTVKILPTFRSHMRDILAGISMLHVCETDYPQPWASASSWPMAAVKIYQA